jgi:solute carrier family 25 (mitochondrial S-adenosylmethionine transporter), member 26
VEGYLPRHRQCLHGELSFWSPLSTDVINVGALFFVVYEGGKRRLLPELEGLGLGGGTARAVTHMIAASGGELASCVIRVPTEVVKQRAQALRGHSSLSAFKDILAAKNEGVFRGLYRGLGITVMREIPFTMIQFPLYEGMKRWWAQKRGKRKVNALEAGVCGCIAGGVGAGVTTPLDVLKTRIMLAPEVGSKYCVGNCRKYVR